MDNRYTIKTTHLLNQNSLRWDTEVIPAGLLLVERQETERLPFASNEWLNNMYEGPTLITQRSETLIMIFPFVENLAQRAQLTRSWLLDELADLAIPSLPLKCHYKTSYEQYVRKTNQYLKIHKIYWHQSFITGKTVILLFIIV